MKRGNFLKALVGFGFVAAIPKEEDNPVITSEDGRTAWDSEGQVWQEAEDYWLKPSEIVEDSIITYDIPTHTLRQGDRTYYPHYNTKTWIWTQKS